MTDLPFGQTRTTPAEIRSLVEIDTAVMQARRGNVDHPEDQIEGFIEVVPSLLEWLEHNGRLYPWRETEDPWEVYIAEILLQRTRGDAVERVYTEFLETFPDPESLMHADEEEIADKVRSLGFVNHRTRTLKEVGELFTKEYGGKVPDSVDKLKRPWRVGDYSARACQIFARGEIMALVDTNFARVIGRVLGYEMPTQPHKSSEVYALLYALVPSSSDLARAFNFAILDLGALVCTPKNPDCESCPVNDACNYYQMNFTT